MSWSTTGFYRNKEEANKAIVENKHLPEIVKAQIVIGISGCAEHAVFIEGHGHLFNGDHPHTTCTLTVKPMPFTIKEQA